MSPFEGKRTKIAGLPYAGEGKPSDSFDTDSLLPAPDIPSGDEDMSNEDIPAAQVKVPDEAPLDSDIDDEGFVSKEQLSECHRQIIENGVFAFIKPLYGYTMGSFLASLREEEDVFQAYRPYTELALNYYNIMNGKNFYFKDMVRVNKVFGSTSVLYITFRAVDRNAADDSTASQRFQAHLDVDCFGHLSYCRQSEIVIVFCRLEPATQGGSSGYPYDGSSSKNDGFDDVAGSRLARLDKYKLFDDTLLARLAVMFYNLRNSSDCAYEYEYQNIESVDKNYTEYDELDFTIQAKDMSAVYPEIETKTFEAIVKVDYLGRFSRKGSLGYYHPSGRAKLIFDFCQLKSTTKQGDSWSDSMAN